MDSFYKYPRVRARLLWREGYVFNLVRAGARAGVRVRVRGQDFFSRLLRLFSAHLLHFWQQGINFINLFTLSFSKVTSILAKTLYSILCDLTFP